MAEPSSRRPGWLAAPVLGAAAISVASGFAQFGITAVIGDVAAAFGAPGAGQDPASQIGLTATTLGVSLAVIRLASLLALPVTALADRMGRRRILLWSLGIGLGFSVLSAAAPGYWAWVLLVAMARPWLTTVNNAAGVVAAEETSSRDRSWAVSLIGGAYGLGAGAVAVMRGFLPAGSWRPAMAAAGLGLVALPWLARRIRETEVFEKSATETVGIGLGVVPADHRRLVVLLCLVTAGMGLATGPGFTYLFVYGEKVLGASPGQMSWLILAAGPTGLVGLLAGRWAADHLGRRPAAALSMVGTAAMVAVAYAGSFGGLAVGYLAGITTSAAFAPATGAMVAEAFPTDIRSTATAWVGAAGVVGAVSGLALYGVLVDAFGGFGPAAIALALPVAVVASLLWFVPETRGRELTAA